MNKYNPDNENNQDETNRCRWCGASLPAEFETCEEYTRCMCWPQLALLSQRLCDLERGVAEWEQYMTYNDGSLGE